MQIIYFKIDTEYIELIKLLKATNLVSTGGEAKIVVENGLVKCNNIIELRKRHKLRHGDIVEYKSQQIRIGK